MLTNLPSNAPADERERPPEPGLIAELARLVERAAPFASPLEHFEVRQTGARELVLSEIRLEEEPLDGAAARWSESPLAVARRTADGEYELVRPS
jgi:hypothetical protein